MYFDVEDNMNEHKLKYSINYISRSEFESIEYKKYTLLEKIKMFF